MGGHLRFRGRTGTVISTDVRCEVRAEIGIRWDDGKYGHIIRRHVRPLNDSEASPNEITAMIQQQIAAGFHL